MVKQVKKRAGSEPNSHQQNKVGVMFGNGEEKFRALIENSADAIYLVDGQGTVIYESPSYSRVMGYKVNDRIGKNAFDLVHSDDRDNLARLLMNLIQTPGRVSIPPIRVQHGDGTWHWIEGVANNLLHELAVGAIVINFRDITERKQMEEALRKSEEKYRLLFDHASDAIFIYDDDGVLLEFNSLALERYGYLREELKSMTIFQVNSPEESKSIPERIEQLMHKGRHTYETTHQRKDGSPIPTDVSARRVIWDGQPAILSICRDITQRKRGENALRASKEKFHRFVEQSSEGFALADEEGAIIEWNRACEEITGWTYEQVAGIKIWDVQYSLALPEERTPELYEKRTALFQSALRTGQSPIFNTVFEAQLMKPSGERRFFRQTVFPIKTDNGYQLGFVSHDITESKVVEAHLRDSEEKYRLLFEIESDALFLIDSSTGQLLEVNTSAESLYGYTREELLKMKNIELSAEPEETRKSLERPQPLILLRYHRKKDGTVFPVEITTSDLTRHGRSLRIAAIRDITERKRAEESLRHMSTHDILTGIFNRAFFETELERLASSREFPVSIVIGDLDNMKITNDTLGHAIGDELLKNAARILHETFRTEDIIARIGGDEFAVLLPNTDAATAELILARVHTKLAEHNSQYPDLNIQLSLGVSTAERGKLMEAFILADQRMYADKNRRKSGR